MRTKLFLLLTAFACQPAFASGGIHCTADGDGVTFEVGGGVTHGMGGPLFSFEGELERSRARASRPISARQVSRASTSRNTGWTTRICACCSTANGKATSRMAMSS